MFSGFNFVDLSVVIFLLIYIVLTFRRGFISSLFEFFGFSLSLNVAIFLFHLPSALLQIFKLHTGVADTISFVALWLITETLFLSFFRKTFKHLPMEIILSRFNRYLGLIPNLLSGLLIVVFVGLLLIVLPINSLVKSQVTQSRILGSTLPFFGHLNKSLETAFSSSVRDSLVYLTNQKSEDDDTFIKLNVPADVSLKPDIDSETQIFVLINQERAKLNLKELQFNQQLAQVARSHSEDMFKRSYFGHLDPNGKTPLDRARAVNLVFTKLGENISFAPDALTAHKGFMDSSGHRANILLPSFNKVGIGVVDSGTYGKMFTELFSD